MKGKRKIKVIVAMSGGIDSSVAAALLKRVGFDVVGVFMKFWSAPASGGKGRPLNRCCSLEAEKRARKVARILNMPFYVFNFEKEFKKRIVDYFLGEYEKGVTPNPCVVCNKEIKLGLFLEKAVSLGADFVATGHYADTKNTEGECKLLAAKDKNKDQSYFLWMLSRQQLKRILFPISNYSKDKVRQMAKKFKLPVLNIPESMEICFVDKSINDFLARYAKAKPGAIIDGKGKTVGRHKGLCFYTIGQRKGIGLPGGPFYVLGKNLKKNTLVVTGNEKDLDGKELNVKNVNWISGRAPKLPLKVNAKIRYRHKAAPAIIARKIKANAYNLKFKKPQRAITPGQSAVFYKGREVLGGGVIY